MYLPTLISCKSVMKHQLQMCRSASSVFGGYLGPFPWHGSTLILAWMNNYSHHKVWDEITYPVPNINGADVEICIWIGDFIPHITGMWLLFHAGIIVISIMYIHVCVYSKGGVWGQEGGLDHNKMRCCIEFVQQISVFNVCIDSWVYLSISVPIFIGPCMTYVYLLNKLFLISDF